MSPFKMLKLPNDKIKGTKAFAAIIAKCCFLYLFTDPQPQTGALRNGDVLFVCMPMHTCRALV